jgi:hypothetical protein
VRENHWFDEGDRGVHRPEHGEVGRLVARAVRRWAVALSAALIGVAAYVTSGEPPPPGIADAAGVAALVALTLAWPRAAALGGVAAVGLALSARNTALQGPWLLSGAGLLVGLLAWRTLRRCRETQHKYGVRPVGYAGAGIAAGGAALAVVSTALHAAGVTLGGAAVEAALWAGALALGIGISAGTKDHPGRAVARTAAGTGGAVLALLGLLVALAYGT